MEQATDLVKKTRVVIISTLVVFILLGILNIYVRSMNGTLHLRSIISVLLGVFSIFSLLKAKKWAKNLVTVYCSWVILTILTAFLLRFKLEFTFPTLINIATLPWCFYLIKFLNQGDTYEKYVKMVHKGFDISSLNNDDHSEIFNKNQLINFTRTAFKSNEDYLELTSKIFDNSSVKGIESIELVNDSVVLNTNTNNYEVPIDQESIFFDNNFLKNLNAVLAQIWSNYTVAIICPNTVADKSILKIGVLENDDFQVLSSTFKKRNDR